MDLLRESVLSLEFTTAMVTEVPSGGHVAHLMDQFNIRLIMVFNNLGIKFARFLTIMWGRVAHFIMDQEFNMGMMVVRHILKVAVLQIVLMYLEVEIAVEELVLS